ncbi:MAG: sodium/proton-translocating pyrophosphatase [Clostridia bacterium]|nr:sodium/proton-translocating pyrophosphatase [Clostridia bacterium]
MQQRLFFLPLNLFIRYCQFTPPSHAVGDPFKDTAGPAINILIKLLSMVSIVFAALVVKYNLAQYFL